MDLIVLQNIWFFLVGILFVGYSLLDGFDLGTGMLFKFIAKRDAEKRVLFNAIGPFWDGNEVWLITGGGALFAAFPHAYATVFSGFYLALFLVLFGLIFRAVSLEFWMHDFARRGLWDAAGRGAPSAPAGTATGGEPAVASTAGSCGASSARSSARRNSPPVENRRSGRLASARSKKSSSAGDRPGTRRVIGIGVSWAME